MCVSAKIQNLTSKLEKILKFEIKEEKTIHMQNCASCD